MVKLNQESCEWLPLKTGWYRGYTFVPVILWQGFSISFKEPRPKVAGEFSDIDADGAKDYGRDFLYLLKNEDRRSQVNLEILMQTERKRGLRSYQRRVT